MNYRRNLGTFFLLASAALLSNTAHADDTYYRWIDDRGETILSDRPPPPGTDYNVVSTQSRFSNVTTDDKSNSEEQESVATTVKSQKDPELCKVAMDNFDALKNSKRIAMRDENGNAKVLSEQEIKDHLATTKSQVAAFCE